MEGSEFLSFKVAKHLQLLPNILYSKENLPTNEGTGSKLMLQGAKSRYAPRDINSVQLWSIMNAEPDALLHILRKDFVRAVHFLERQISLHAMCFASSQ